MQEIIAMDNNEFTEVRYTAWL